MRALTDADGSQAGDGRHGRGLLIAGREGFHPARQSKGRQKGIGLFSIEPHCPRNLSSPLFHVDP
jgi:hypothetical protein